jgi:hypothetical protein
VREVVALRGKEEKGRGGHIGVLGRVAGEGAPGHGWPAAQGIGSGGVGRGARGS